MSLETAKRRTRMTKIYLKHGQKPPAWAHVETGPKGGKFYEDEAPEDPSADVESGDESVTQAQHVHPDNLAREQPGTQPVRHGLSEDELILEDFGLDKGRLWEAQAAAYQIFSPYDTVGSHRSWDQFTPGEKKAAAEYVHFGDLIEHYDQRAAADPEDADQDPEDQPEKPSMAKGLFYEVMANVMVNQMKYSQTQEDPTGEHHRERMAKVLEDPGDGPGLMYWEFKKRFESECAWLIVEKCRSGWLNPEDQVRFDAQMDKVKTPKERDRVYDGLVQTFHKLATQEEKTEIEKRAILRLDNPNYSLEGKMDLGGLRELAKTLFKDKGVDPDVLDPFQMMSLMAAASLSNEVQTVNRYRTMVAPPGLEWTGPKTLKDGRAVTDRDTSIEWQKENGRRKWWDYLHNPKMRPDLQGQVDVPITGQARSDFPDISETEYDAFKEYTGTGFNEMKGVLRESGRYWEAMQPGYDWKKEQAAGKENPIILNPHDRYKAEGQVEQIDKMMTRTTIREPREIFHGLADFKGLGVEEVKIGDEIADKSYTSWSDDPWVSYEFTAHGGYAHGKIPPKTTWNPEGLPLVLHIKNAKGLHGIYSGGGEYETVLPHGMRYKVLAVNDTEISPFSSYGRDPVKDSLDPKVMKKWRVIDVEAVPDSWQQKVPWAGRVVPPTLDKSYPYQTMKAFTTLMDSYWQEKPGNMSKHHYWIGREYSLTEDELARMRAAFLARGNTTFETSLNIDELSKMAFIWINQNLPHKQTKYLLQEYTFDKAFGQ